jgi:aldehyde dehydrogenase (NAD+)
MYNPVTSIVDGSPATGVRTVASTDPAQLDEVVGEVSLAGAELTPDTTFRR